jgi:hypothetical protein
MAVAGIGISVEFTELERIRRDLLALGRPRATSTLLGDALKKAIVPAYQRLQQVTPQGPTGNLLRAATTKIKTYPNDGGAVALVGYERSGVGSSQSAQGGTVRAGKDRAFHQWWLEFGTKPRQINRKSTTPYGRRGHTRRLPGRPAVEVRPHIVKAGQNQYIASSFNRLGPFRTLETPRDDENRRVATEPGYPKAFFRASSVPFQIPPTPPGGVAGKPPVQTAFEDSSGQMAAILQEELAISLSRAWNALVLRDSGSVTGA